MLIQSARRPYGSALASRIPSTSRSLSAGCSAPGWKKPGLEARELGTLVTYYIYYSSVVPWVLATPLYMMTPKDAAARRPPTCPAIQSPKRPRGPVVQCLHDPDPIYRNYLLYNIPEPKWGWSSEDLAFPFRQQNNNQTSLDFNDVHSRGVSVSTAWHFSGHSSLDMRTTYIQSTRPDSLPSNSTCRYPPQPRGTREPVGF